MACPWNIYSHLSLCDRRARGDRPERFGTGSLVSLWLVVALLLASVAMFIALVQRISMLQINRMLIFTGDQGRKVITTTYPSTKPAVAATRSNDFHALPCTQTLIHRGRPCSIQAIRAATLVNLAEASGGVIEMAVAVGDTVVELMPLLRIFDARQSIGEKDLRDGIEIGDERTFEQDPSTRSGC